MDIRCRVEQIDGLSAHADYEELMDWLQPLVPPRRTFITHGEPVASDALRQRLERQMGWTVTVPNRAMNSISRNGPRRARPTASQFAPDPLYRNPPWQTSAALTP
jgi:Cft2 family RNA processing exonuclease